MNCTNMGTELGEKPGEKIGKKKQYESNQTMSTEKEMRNEGMERPENGNEKNIK